MILVFNEKSKDVSCISAFHMLTHVYMKGVWILCQSFRRKKYSNDIIKYSKLNIQ